MVEPIANFPVFQRLAARPRAWNSALAKGAAGGSLRKRARGEQEQAWGDPLRLGGRRFAALFASLALAAAVPVLLCDTLPLFDYPNHLARMHILASLPDSGALQRYYEIVWRLLPNLAMDLVVPPLAAWMPLEVAGKLFVLSTFALLAGGAALLHRVLFGSWSAWPVLGFLLLFSRTLLWGFLNYLFGLGLGLVALAAWIALARRPALRAMLGTLLALALFFAHLLAFALYGVLVLGYEASSLWRERPPWRQSLSQLLLAGTTFLPALAILIWLTPGTIGGAVRFSQPLRKLDLLFSVFDNYSRPFDVVCFVLVALGLGFAFWRRWIALHAAMKGPLALLFLVYLAMPNQLATASGADHRIPVLLGLVLVAGSRWTAAKPRLAGLFLAGGLLLFAVRTGVVANAWHDSDRVYASLLPGLDGVPIGDRLAVAHPADAVNSTATPLAHFPVLAVVRRDAFVPTLFAFATQQPVALRPTYRALADRLGPERLWAALVERTATLEEDERAALREYHFLALVGRRPFVLPETAGLRPLVVTPRFVLVQVDPAVATR